MEHISSSDWIEWILLFFITVKNCFYNFIFLFFNLTHIERIILFLNFNNTSEIMIEFPIIYCESWQLKKFLGNIERSKVNFHVYFRSFDVWWELLIYFLFYLFSFYEIWYCTGFCIWPFFFYVPILGLLYLYKIIN